MFLLFKQQRNLSRHILYFFDICYSRSEVVFNQKSNKEIAERIMDSESSSGPEDYSYDESWDENEDNSNSEEEFINSFENISTTSRHWRKKNFNPRLFNFDSSGSGLSSTVKNLTLETLCQ